MAVVIARAAGEHSVSESERKPDQDHRLRSGALLRPARGDEGDVRHAGVHGARGRTVRPYPLLDRHVERRRHLLRTVSHFRFRFRFLAHFSFSCSVPGR